MSVSSDISVNIAIQYTLVALFMIGAVAWIIRKVFWRDKKQKSSCCGCSLSESCSKIKSKNHCNGIK